MTQSPCVSMMFKGGVPSPNSEAPLSLRHHCSHPSTKAPEGLGPARPPNTSASSWQPKHTPTMRGRCRPAGTLPRTSVIIASASSDRQGRDASVAQWWLPVKRTPFAAHNISKSTFSPRAIAMVLHSIPSCSGLVHSSSWFCHCSSSSQSIRTANYQFPSK